MFDAYVCRCKSLANSVRNTLCSGWYYYTYNMSILDLHDGGQRGVGRRAGRDSAVGARDLRAAAERQLLQKLRQGTVLLQFR